MSFELFYKDIENNVLRIECNEENMTDVIDIIKQKLLGTKILCLDLHGVADIFHYTEQISKLPICIVSYVGSVAKNQASMSITRRLDSNQITIGILVFNRIKISPKIKESQIIGTKCWFLNLLSNNFNNTHFLFFDDGKDHIQLVKLFGNKYIKAFHIETKNKQTLKNIILNHIAF